MIHLMQRSYLVMSDSGGLQEEAAVLRKPLVLMRDTTERPEAVAANVVYPAGTEEDGIYGITTRLLEDAEFYNTMSSARNPFGDGQASRRIVQIVAHHFGFEIGLPGPFRPEP